MSSILAAAFALVFLILGASQSASAIPAFARKYGLRCSACHESWPMLNFFGQKFKDNGYQLMNDRDAPIWQNPSYWPVTFRMTPIWHRVSTNKNQVDGVDGLGADEAKISSSGFDLSGLDFHTAGTVSYTHLDVYKRQPLHLPAQLGNVLFQGFAGRIVRRGLRWHPS